MYSPKESREVWQAIKADGQAGIVGNAATLERLMKNPQFANSSAIQRRGGGPSSGANL